MMGFKFKNLYLERISERLGLSSAKISADHADGLDSVSLWEAGNAKALGNLSEATKW